MKHVLMMSVFLSTALMAVMSDELPLLAMRLRANDTESVDAWRASFRAVALVNTRISTQGPVRVKLRTVPEDIRTVTWHELCREPKVLPVERMGDAEFVTIPTLGAWNAGYMDFSSGRIGGVK